MPKLRLLYTKKCNRNCEECCNKNWDLDNLPRASNKDLVESSEILITGGEPMLNPDGVIGLIKFIRGLKPDQIIYMYTAKCDDWVEFLRVMRELNGVCLTLHDAKDVIPFIELDRLMSKDSGASDGKSLRLNVFNDAHYYAKENELYCRWKIRNNHEWIKNCPLPKDEVFKRL